MIRPRARVRRRGLRLAVLLTLLALAILIAAGPRVRVEPYTPSPPALPEDLDRWLSDRESHVPALRPELAMGIRWAAARGARTPLAIVYFHGFSASRRELSPVLERLGAALGANVLFTRLRGHGQDGDALGAVRVTDWMTDADEALAIARRLGDRVVLVGMSTGGTLATWLAARTPDLHALVLLSPNFGLKDPMARLLLWPWGLQLAKLAFGDYRAFRPASPQQERFWTTRYRVEALGAMAALVRVVDRLDLARLRTPTLVLYTPDDEVLDVGRIVARAGALGAERKRLVALPGAGHVLAGDAVSPGNNAVVLRHLEEFLH